MSRLFVSVLGTGNYSDCYYYKDDKYNDNECVKTPFIQDALIKFLYKDKNLDFDMKLLLTKEAKNTNYTKLENNLAKYHIQPTLVDIPEGKNNDELLNIFNIVNDTIDESSQDLLKKYQDIISKCYELNDILFKYNKNIKPTESLKVNNIKNINKLWDILKNATERVNYIAKDLHNLFSINQNLNSSLIHFLISNQNDEYIETLNLLKNTIDENTYILLIELNLILEKYHELEHLINKSGYNIELELNKIQKNKNNFKVAFNNYSDIILKNIKNLLSLNVTIDITHSLRNIPMQILVAMNYLTIFNDIKLEGIYYGAFELGETIINNDIFSSSNNKIHKLKTKKELTLKLEDLKDKNKIDINLANDILSELKQDSIDINILKKLENATSINDLDNNTINIITKDKSPYRDLTIKRAPICNLNTYYNLLKWTNAVNSFLNCGSSLEIKNLLNNDIIINTKDLKLVEKVVNSLDNFTNCINTCRGKFFENMSNKNTKKSIKSAAQQLDKDLFDLGENISKTPLKKLFNIIKNEIKPFINKSDLQIGIATVDWCIKYNLYQQGYTALDESLKTLICVKLKDFYGEDAKYIDETNAKEREDIANIILTCTIYDKKTDKYIPKPSEKIIFKKLNDEKKKQITLKSLNILSYNKDFYKFVECVKNYRNDINHFGFSASGATSFNKLSSELLGLRNKLVKFSQGDFPWYTLK